MVWFLLALHQLCRPKEQGPADLHSIFKHPGEWAGCVGATKMLSFIVMNKICPDLSASNITNVPVKQEGEKFFRAIQSPQQTEIEVIFALSAVFLNRPWKRCMQTFQRWIKECWNEGVNADECFSITYVKLCQIYYFLREIDVNHWTSLTYFELNEKYQDNEFEDNRCYYITWRLWWRNLKIIENNSHHLEV